MKDLLVCLPMLWREENIDRHGSIRTPEIAEQAARYGDGFFASHILWPKSHFQRLVTFYRSRYAYYGHGTPQEAIVGLGGHIYVNRQSQVARERFRPFFDNAPVYGHGPSLEEFMRDTPLSVGSPQEIIDKTLTFREQFGDYQRQLFLFDHAGIPLPEVLEMLELFGSEEAGLPLWIKGPFHRLNAWLQGTQPRHFKTG